MSGSLVLAACAHRPRRRRAQGLLRARLPVAWQGFRRGPEPGCRVVRDLLERRLPGKAELGRGSAASMTVWPASARTTTSQGSSSPIRRSAVSAWCARGGLQAPRIGYSSLSSPRLPRRLTCTPMSVSRPKPYAWSASRTGAAASSKGTRAGQRCRSPDAVPCFIGWWLVPVRPGPAPPGEDEESFSKLLHAHRGASVLGEGLPHPAGRDLETGPVRGTRYRGELGDDLGAVPAGPDYRDNAGQLALARQSRSSTWPAAWSSAFMTAGNARALAVVQYPGGYLRRCPER